MQPPPALVRVVVADDEPFYRQGLGKLLRDSHFDVLAEAADGPGALEAVAGTAPDVVVVDLHMPGVSGLEVTRRLTGGEAPRRVLVISPGADEDDVADAILAGASGFVLKDEPFDELVTAIRQVAAGHAAFSPSITSMLLGWTRARLRIERAAPAEALSRREVEVLRLVAEGLENPEIGQALFIGPSTVKNHVSSILSKLHVDNRVQAAVRAVREDLV